MQRLVEISFQVLSRYSKQLSLVVFCFSISVYAQLPQKFHLGTGEWFQKIYDVKQNKSSEIILATENGFYKFNGQKFLPVLSPERKPLNKEFLYLDASNSGVVYGKTIDGKVYEITETVKLLLDNNWDRIKFSRPYYYQGYFYYLSSKRNVIAICASLRDTVEFSLSKTGVERIRERLLYVDSNYFFYQNIPENEKVMVYDRVTGRTISNDVKAGRSNSEVVVFQGNKYILENRKSGNNRAFVLTNNNLERTTRFDSILDQLVLIRSEKTANSLALYGFNGLTIFNSSVNRWTAIDTSNIVTGAVFLNDSSVWYATLNEGLFFVPNIYSQSYRSDINFKHLALAEEKVFATDESDKLYLLENKYLAQQAQYSNFTFVNRNSKDSLLLKQKHLDFYKSRVVDAQPSFGFNKAFYQNSKLAVYASTNAATVRFINFQHAQSYLPDSYLSNSDLKGENLYRLSSLRTFDIALDTVYKKIYLSTIKGVQIIEKSGEKWLKRNGDRVAASSILVNNQQQLLCGTRNGLVLFDESGNFRKEISRFNGFHVNRLRFIDTNLVVATNHGFFICNERDTLYFDRNDGLPNNDVYDVISDKDAFVVATRRGLGKIPREKLKGSKKPLLTLGGVKVNQVIQESYGELELQPEENDVEITLVGKDLYHLGELKYYFSDDDAKSWQVVQNGVVQFLNLPSGDYNFSFKAKNSINTESDVFSLSFRIKRPFYETPLFIATALLLIFGSIFLAIRIRARRKEQHLIKDRQKVEAELSALKSQMNPHFIFNSLSSIQALIVSQQTDDAEYYLQRFAVLIRKSLDFSRKNSVPLKEEQDFLTNYLKLESLRFSGELDCEVTISENLQQEQDLYTIPPLIVQPFVENAIKHGLLHSKRKDKIVRVEFSLEGDRLICRVSDNGIGRAKSNILNQRKRNKPKSYSTNAIRNRIELINNQGDFQLDLSIVDLEGDSGMEVVLVIEHKRDFVSD